MNKTRMFFLITILFMSIGCAAVSTILFINGTANVVKNEKNFTDGVIFDASSLRTTEGTVASVSNSGKTLTFTTQDMDTINDYATVYFKIKNNSQYKTALNSPAINCYFVNEYEADKKSVSTAENSYLDLIPSNDIDNAVILSGGISNEASVTVKQVRSYGGTDEMMVKYQCEINLEGKE